MTTIDNWVAIAVGAAAAASPVATALGGLLRYASGYWPIFTRPAAVFTAIGVDLTALSQAFSAPSSDVKANLKRVK